MRKFTMTPIEPRTAGSLKGFGFTVTWGDDQSSVDDRAVDAAPVVEGSTSLAGAEGDADRHLIPSASGGPSAPGEASISPASLGAASNDDFATIPHLGPVA